jgi:hypothetical protein
MKNTIYIVLGLLIILISIIVILVLQRSSFQGTSPTSNGSITPTVVSEHTRTFSNPNFPSFSFDYPRNLSVLIKQYNQLTKDYFYTENCSKDCLGIQIKKGSTTLNIGLEQASDSNLIQCTSKASVTELPNNWLRFNGSKIFYTKMKYTKTNYKVTVSDASAYGYGSENDEWSVIESKTYNYCIFGEGDILKDESKGPILMKFPEVSVNPDKAISDDFDAIISSIKGI